MSQGRPASAQKRPLYSPEERARRDHTRWTLVQGALAPLQFAIFLVSLALVLRFLLTGAGESAATISVVVKTIALYAIMITGSIWEKVVFGKYLFARPFFWEDAFSILVLSLHTAYLAALVFGLLEPARAHAARACSLRHLCRQRLAIPSEAAGCAPRRRREPRLDVAAFNWSPRHEREGSPRRPASDARSRGARPRRCCGSEDSARSSAG